MADAVLAESRLFWKLVIEPTIFQEYFCTPVIRVFESEPEPCSQPGHFWSCIFTETMINSWVTIEIEIKRIRIAGIPPKLHNRRRHRHHSDDDRNEHEYHDDEERYDQIPGPSLQPRSKHPSPSGNGLENEDDGGTPIRTQYKTTIALHTPQKLAPVMYLFLNDDATSVILDADSILNRNKYELEFVITEEIPTYQVPSPSSCHRILDTLFHDIVVTVKPDPVTADIFFEFPVEKNLGAASRSYSSSSSQESPQSNSSTSSSHYRREDYRHGIVTVAAHEHILSRFPKIAAWIERERMTQVEARIRQLEEKSRIAREQQNMWRPVSYPTLTLLTNSKQFNIDGNGNSDTPLPIRNDELREGGQSGGCDYHYNELSQTPFPEQQRATAVGHPSTSTASMPPHPVSAAFFSTPPPLRRTSRDVESEHGDPYELDSNSQKVQRTSHHPQHLDHQHNQQQQFIQPQYQHPHLLQQQQQEQEQQQQRHHPRWLQEHRSWEQEVQQQRQQGEQQRWQPQQYEEQPRFQQQQQEEEEVLEYEARARDHFLSHLLDQPCAHVALTTAQYPHQYPYEQCDHPRQHEYHLQSCPHYQQTERDSSLVSPLPSFNLPAPLPRSCEEFQPLPSILRIPVRDISVATFQAMLQYLYTGEIGISEEQAFEIHVDLNDNAEDHPFDSVDSLTPPPAGSPAVPAYRQDPVLSAGTGGTNDIQPHTSIILPPIGIQSQTSRYPTKPSFSRRLFSFEQCDVRRLPNQQGSGISDEQTTAFYPQLLGAPALSWPVYKPTSSSTFTSWLPCSRLNRNSRLGQRGGSDVPSGRTVSGGNENNNQGHGGTEGSVSSDSCTGNGAFERISRYNGYNDTISVRRASFSALPSSSSFSESDHRCSWESLLLMAWKFALRDLEGLAKKAMAIRSSINYTDMAKATHSRFDEINMDLQLAWSEQVLCEFLKLYNPPFVRVRRDGHGILTGNAAREEMEEETARSRIENDGSDNQSVDNERNPRLSSPTALSSGEHVDQKGKRPAESTKEKLENAEDERSCSEAKPVPQIIPRAKEPVNLSDQTLLEPSSSPSTSSAGSVWSTKARKNMSRGVSGSRKRQMNPILEETASPPPSSGPKQHIRFQKPLVAPLPSPSASLLAPRPRLKQHARIQVPPFEPPSPLSPVFVPATPSHNSAVHARRIATATRPARGTKKRLSRITARPRLSQQKQKGKVAIPHDAGPCSSSLPPETLLGQSREASPGSGVPSSSDSSAGSQIFGSQASPTGASSFSLSTSSSSLPSTSPFESGEDVTGEASGPKGQKYPDCELTILEFCQELRSRYFRIRNILDGE